MIVAMVSMRVMQVAGNQIVGVVPMWDRLLALMTAGACDGRTFCRVLGAHRNGMLIIVALVLRVQMTLVQVIGVTVVLHAWVAAALVVDMRMIAMGFVTHVVFSLWSEAFSPSGLFQRHDTRSVLPVLLRRSACPNEAWRYVHDPSSKAAGRSKLSETC
jgi:hypothetical protein